MAQETPPTALAPLDPSETVIPGVLAPLPAHEPDPDWQQVAQTVSSTYLQLRKDELDNPGRRSLLGDPNLLAHLFDGIAAGLTPPQAGNALGLNGATISQWLAWATDPQKPLQAAFATFADACQMAKDRRRRRLMGRLEKASEKDQHWTAAAWLLERGYGDDYKLAQDKKSGQVLIQIGVKDSDLTLNVSEPE